jgi:hypothetical protein
MALIEASAADPRYISLVICWLRKGEEKRQMARVYLSYLEKMR